jgi:hypothetical protein
LRQEENVVRGKWLVQVLFVALILMISSEVLAQRAASEEQVTEYIRQFPYQDTYNYAKTYTRGDPGRFNKWLLGSEPVLVKAGEDKVVRTNNDTFYKMAFVSLSKGPVVLTSTTSAKDRFSSFQLMDDHNVNYRNIIRPKGAFTLYRGEKPDEIRGEAIEVPSDLSVVIVRVEVKNKNDEKDLGAAEGIFTGIGIEGPEIDEFPALDLLSGFEDAVQDEANERMDETFQRTPFRETVAGPDDVPKKVSYLRLAAGTKGAWGGPVTSHSSYETLFFGANGKKLDGSKGTYTVTTEEPPVDAFWSLTVYDTERGGFLHPNKDDRHHINNTTAVKNSNATVTFLFKPSCEPIDRNCLEVPSGEFDLVARYYLPHEEIRTGAWTLPKIQLVDE